MLNNVLNFWFEEIEPVQWWKKDPEFDQHIRDQFYSLHQQACGCELFSWRSTAQGKLAEIIILDQFSRNMFRDTAQAFAADPLALALAQEAVRSGADMQVPQNWRAFFYLPYMHSESLIIHGEAMKLYQQPGMEDNLVWEIKHHEIIKNFGRYPHRNKALGRTSTDAEIEFLKQPGSRF